MDTVVDIAMGVEFDIVSVGAAVPRKPSDEVGTLDAACVFDAQPVRTEAAIVSVNTIHTDEASLMPGLGLFERAHIIFTFISYKAGMPMLRTVSFQPLWLPLKHLPNHGRGVAVDRAATVGVGVGLAAAGQQEQEICLKPA